ncbi:hypothetical protein H0H93_012832, partial [Arthromyces matolae]
ALTLCVSFREGLPGGLNFKSDTSPARSYSASNSVAKLAKKAGLPRSGTYSLRRDAGDAFGLMMGKHIVKAVLNHQKRGAYAVHYSRSTANLDAVSLRLGESKGSVGSAQVDSILIQALSFIANAAL